MSADATTPAPTVSIGTPAGRPPLSVAIICKDADRTIGRTLESVAGWADEIVAIDSGSTDQTIPLLERHDAKVIVTEWKGFVRTRQASIDACAHDWVLCLDADESPDDVQRRSIDAFLAALGSGDDQEPAGATLNRKIWFRGRPLDHAWQPERRLRLIHRARAYSSGFDPHGELVPNDVAAGIGAVDGTLRHDGFVTFADQLGKDLGYARAMALSLHAEGVRGSRRGMVVSPVAAFFKQMVFKQAWRDGWPGWCAAVSVSTATALKHIMLFELTHAGEPGVNGDGAESPEDR